jgi:hypothetical protein
VYICVLITHGAIYVLLFVSCAQVTNRAGEVAGIQTVYMCMSTFTLITCVYVRVCATYVLLLVSCAQVTNKAGGVVGIISERDYVCKIALLGRQSQTTKVWI